MATATATTYEGTFHGRADEVARVRKEIAAYLGECPVADDLVLIADELASNSILHTKSRGGSFHVRCELSPGSARVEVEDMEVRGARASMLTGPTGWTSCKRSPGRTAGAPTGPPVIPAWCGQPSNGPDVRRCDEMTDTWETTVRTAATMMLRYPERISDGLEAELYALLDQLDTATADQPEARRT